LEGCGVLNVQRTWRPSPEGCGVAGAEGDGFIFGQTTPMQHGSGKSISAERTEMSSAFHRNIAL
jgi:hypothetical protein